MQDVDLALGSERGVGFAVVENMACRYGGGRFESNQKQPQKAVSRALPLK